MSSFTGKSIKVALCTWHTIADKFEHHTWELGIQPSIMVNLISTFKCQKQEMYLPKIYQRVLIGVK